MKCPNCKKKQITKYCATCGHKLHNCKLNWLIILVLVIAGCGLYVNNVIKPVFLLVRDSYQIFVNQDLTKIDNMVDIAKKYSDSETSKKIDTLYDIYKNTDVDWQGVIEDVSDKGFKVNEDDFYKIVEKHTDSDVDDIKKQIEESLKDFR